MEKRHSAVFKCDAPIKEFDDVERSILTVTSILRRQHSPTTTNPSEIQPFLRHLATLLTCGDENDPDSKKSVAVTGSLTVEGFQILVVTQNSFNSGDRAELRVQRLKRSSGTFEVVKGYVCLITLFPLRI